MIKLATGRHLLLLTSFFVFGCRQDKPWDIESARLMAEAAQIENRHAILDQRVDSLWDAVSHELSLRLPADFPPIDRDIFIKARNADHIRMFKSYQLLDQGTRSMIDSAAEYDQMIAGQMRQLMVERLALESEKNHFLQTIYTTDKEAGLRYTQQFRSAENETTN